MRPTLDELKDILGALDAYASSAEEWRTVRGRPSHPSNLLHSFGAGAYPSLVDTLVKLGHALDPLYQPSALASTARTAFDGWPSEVATAIMALRTHLIDIVGRFGIEHWFGRDAAQSVKQVVVPGLDASPYVTADDLSVIATARRMLGQAMESWKRDNLAEAVAGAVATARRPSSPPEGRWSEIMLMKAIGPKLGLSANARRRSVEPCLQQLGSALTEVKGQGYRVRLDGMDPAYQKKFEPAES